MIYSKTSEYAIRVLVHFAKMNGGKSLKIRQVSRATGVPQAYLAKVLLCLVRKRFLKSEPGPTGGFSLQADLSKLSVYEVLAAVDDFPGSQFSSCVMGLNQCNDKTPCILHEAWVEAKNEILSILSKATIQDLVTHPSNFRFGSPKRITLSKSMRSIFHHPHADK